MWGALRGELLLGPAGGGLVAGAAGTDPDVAAAAAKCLSRCLEVGNNAICLPGLLSVLACWVGPAPRIVRGAWCQRIPNRRGSQRI